MSERSQPTNTTTIRTTVVPASALLSAWNSFEWRNGLHLDRLLPLDRLTVRTRHSTYEIVIINPATAEILVRGGAFFPAFTAARLAGSSLGGSFLKLRSIFVGFHVEIAAAHGVIVTSPVRTIELGAGGDGAAPVM